MYLFCINNKKMFEAIQNMPVYFLL